MDKTKRATELAARIRDYEEVVMRHPSIPYSREYRRIGENDVLISRIGWGHRLPRRRPLATVHELIAADLSEGWTPQD